MQQPTGLNLEALKHTLSQRKSHKPVGAKASGGDGKRWYSFPDGTEKVKIRFLPQYNDKGQPGKLVYYHYGIVVPEEMKADKYPPTKIMCLGTHGMECPFCNMLKEYDGRLDLDKIAASGSAYFNVLILEDPTKVGEKAVDPTLPVIMRASAFTLDWLYQQILDPDIGDITDWITGATVTLNRKVAKGAFERSIARGQSPVGDSAFMQKVSENMYDFDKFPTWLPPDETNMRKTQDITVATRASLEERVVQLTQAAPMIVPGTHTGEASAPLPIPGQEAPPLPGPAQPPAPSTGYMPPTASAPTQASTLPPPAAPAPTQQAAPDPAPAPAAPVATQPEAAPPMTPAVASGTPAAPVAPQLATAPAAARDVTPPPAAPTNQAPVQTITKPPGAPECFANAQVFNPEEQKCLVCPHDYNCGLAIQAAAQ